MGGTTQGNLKTSPLEEGGAKEALHEESPDEA